MAEPNSASRPLGPLGVHRQDLHEQPPRQRVDPRLIRELLAMLLLAVGFLLAAIGLIVFAEMTHRGAGWPMAALCLGAAIITVTLVALRRGTR